MQSRRVQPADSSIRGLTPPARLGKDSHQTVLDSCQLRDAGLSRKVQQLVKQLLPNRLGQITLIGLTMWFLREFSPSKSDSPGMDSGTE